MEISICTLNLMSAKEPEQKNMIEMRSFSRALSGSASLRSSAANTLFSVESGLVIGAREGRG